MGTVYTQLSMHERRRSEDWWHAKVPVREMARVLKRHKSTIFREIKRNFWADDAFPQKVRRILRDGSASAYTTAAIHSAQTASISRVVRAHRGPSEERLDA